jgi:hypothetical protein
MRTYLNCPYKMRWLAKKHGSRWDNERRAWYFDGLQLPKQLKRFLRGKSCPKIAIMNSKPQYNYAKHRFYWRR